MYTFEADVVGLLMSSREPYSLYPPCVTPLCNRPVIGIVTQINSDGADPDRAESWLRPLMYRNARAAFEQIDENVYLFFLHKILQFAYDIA